MSTFRFETSDVPVPLTAWVQEKLAKKVGGCVVGRMGTGKSHAVRKALPAANIYVDVRSSDSLLSQRFVADIARQVGSFGTEGKPILEAFRSEGLEASLQVAERAVNGHPFVVDGMDALRVSPASLDEPATILLQEEKRTISDWLRSRLYDFPTLLIGRRSVQDVDKAYQHVHKAPNSETIRLIDAGDDYRDWPLLAKLANNNPALLVISRALISLLPKSAFHSLIAADPSAEDDAPATDLLKQLGQTFLLNAPPTWQNVLSLIQALGDVPLDVLEGLPDGRAELPIRTTPYGFLEISLALRRWGEEHRAALEDLRKLQLVQARADSISILPALADAGAIRPLSDAERTQLLPAIAQNLLDTVNDIRSVEPADADRVLRAHAIYVDLGDLNQAERTASLHVHGLVDLARRTSLNKDYLEAYRQYDRILGSIETDKLHMQGPTGRKLLSYVRSYKTLNGSLAGRVDNAACLEEYRQALANWPDNALWHQRVIETLLRLARPIEATQAMRDAYEQVPDHARRDELLRARPALTALRCGLPLLSLEFIDPLLDASPELCPDVVHNCERVLKQWEMGIEFDELPFQLAPGVQGLVVFHIREKVELHKRASGTWSARLTRPFPTLEGEADRPRAAIEALIAHVGAQAKRLITTPTSDLGDKDIRLKGRLLSLVDALNSDIGLQRDTQRWIIGRIVDKQLIPTMRELPPVEIPEQLLPESTQGLYFVQVPTYRDGIPSGPATKIEPAGSGRGTRDLIELLRRISENAA